MRKVCLSTLILLMSLLFACNNSEEGKDLPKPACTIFQPAGGLSIEKGSVVPITVEASGDPRVFKVVFFINNFQVFSDLSSPFEFVWNTADEMAGVKKIKALAYNIENSTASDEITITITTGGVGIKTPDADFKASETKILVGESVSFMDGSANSPTAWIWNFGDGGTSNQQNPVHTYSKTGMYEVSLIVSNAAGPDTISKKNFIMVSYPDTSVIDIEGNVYKTVSIGGQMWMKENLKTTRYNDGALIPKVTDKEAWSSLGTPAYCWYFDDSSSYANTFGPLYNWYTVNTKKLCPTGWHVPSWEELGILISYLGGDSIAGGKLKEPGTLHWESPNERATNETAFSALPAGYRSNSGYFVAMGLYGAWWTSSESSKVNAFHFFIGYNTGSVVSGAYYKTEGNSVRCIKDN